MTGQWEWPVPHERLVTNFRAAQSRNNCNSCSCINSQWRKPSYSSILCRFPHKVQVRAYAVICRQSPQVNKDKTVCAHFTVIIQWKPAHCGVSGKSQLPSHFGQQRSTLATLLDIQRCSQHSHNRKQTRSRQYPHAASAKLIFCLLTCLCRMHQDMRNMGLSHTHLPKQYWTTVPRAHTSITSHKGNMAPISKKFWRNKQDLF